MTNRPSTTSAATAAQKAEETRQAIVLFAIVILFVCCHALRILLNVNELLTLEVVSLALKLFLKVTKMLFSYNRTYPEYAKYFQPS